MLRQSLVGGAVSICNIVIHALVMTMVIRVAQRAGAKRAESPSLRLAGVMIATILVFKAAHTVEIMVWALAYRIFSAIPDGASVTYFAFVNYTTLGYGDVLPVAQWQLLGPMAAMNGILLFGWSTAVVFDVMRRTLDK